MTKVGARAGMGRAEPVTPVHHCLQIAAATSLVAVCPVSVVWWLRESGLLSSYLAGMAVGVALSFGAAHLGRSVWERRPGSQQLLFSELMVWGFAHRWYSERRLASARAVLGPMSQAQLRLADGLSPERQRKLLEQLARAMDSRDRKTHGHSRRVARYAWMVAMRMDLPREELARIRTAAALHDVGKYGTPLEILRKEGQLDDREYEVMKRHPSDGARLVALMNDEGLTAMVRHHHERLDGTGYPDGLAGEEIPLGARIIAVADTFDALTADRPYRAARPHKQALGILLAESGSQLDPDVVKAFCGHYSGRRPLTFWTSLSALPERALGQLSGGAGAVATAAKAAGAAALIGAIAAGTATLAPPSRARGERLAPLSSAPVLGAQAALDGASTTGGTAGEGGAGHRRRVSAGGGGERRDPAAGGADGLVSAGAGMPVASGEAHTGPQGQAGGSSGEAPSTEETPGGGLGAPHEEAPGAGGSETPGAGGSETPETPSTGTGGGETPTLTGTLETVAGTAETVTGTLETATGTVAATSKALGEAAAPVSSGLGRVTETVKGLAAVAPGLSAAGR